MQYTEIMALFWVLITLIFCSFAMQPSLLANLTRQIHIQITAKIRCLYISNEELLPQCASVSYLKLVGFGK